MFVSYVLRDRRGHESDETIAGASLLVEIAVLCCKFPIHPLQFRVGKLVCLQRAGTHFSVIFAGENTTRFRCAIEPDTEWICQ